MKRLFVLLMLAMTLAGPLSLGGCVVAPARAHYRSVWVHGHWEHAPRGRHWVPGHWRH